jgi:hypothetical protein
MSLRLKQSQVWKKGKSYLRIVQLERLSVGYKDMPSLNTPAGTHHTVTKKEFCRLIKDATLVTDVGTAVIDPSQQKPLPGTAGTPATAGRRPLRNTPGAGPRPPRDQSPRTHS